MESSLTLSFSDNLQVICQQTLLALPPNIFKMQPAPAFCCNLTHTIILSFLDDGAAAWSLSSCPLPPQAVLPLKRSSYNLSQSMSLLSKGSQSHAQRHARLLLLHTHVQAHTCTHTHTPYKPLTHCHFSSLQSTTLNMPGLLLPQSHCTSCSFCLTHSSLI